MFSHCHRLADMLPSTKELIEDLFGAGVDLQRSNKNPWKTGNVDKLHHLQSYWVRLDGDHWPKVKLQSADFTETRNTPIRRHCNIGSMGPPNTVTKVLRLASLKKHGGEGLQFKCVCHFECFHSMFQSKIPGFQSDASNVRLGI